MATTPKLVVIVGETASGKTDLGIKIAQKFKGEIICADSRTVYKGMDVGTAKPTSQEQKKVKHHLLDIVEPNQKYNVAQFQRDALEAIHNISARGKLPIMVGGTGLYIDAVIFDYDFDNKTMSKRRPNTLGIGLRKDRQDLNKRIEARIDTMIRQGFVDEVRDLGEKYGWDNEAMTGTGYRAFKEYLHGKISLEEARQKFIKGDRDLAKRQRTWFRRSVHHESIHWINYSSDAVAIVTTFLDNL